MKKRGFDKYWDYVKRFWDYIWHDDSLMSYVLNFALAFLFIKFLFFPALGFVLNNDYPIVAIVSGSMQHKIVDGWVCHVQFSDVKNKRLDFDEWWKYCGEYYEMNFNITKDEFSEFDYRNGLNIGDVMILYGKDPEKIEVGEVLVFIPENREWFESHGPVIHRVVDKWEEDETIYFQTKGDHNRESAENFETRIPEEDVIGVAAVRIPFVGYAKIWLFNIIQGIGMFFMRLGG
jgi:signal peptidase I